MLSSGFQLFRERLDDIFSVFLSLVNSRRNGIVDEVEDVKGGSQSTSFSIRYRISKMAPVLLSNHYLLVLHFVNLPS